MKQGSFAGAEATPFPKNTSSSPTQPSLGVLPPAERTACGLLVPSESSGLLQGAQL